MVIAFEPGEKLVLTRLEDWFLENLEPEALERLKRRVGKQVKLLAMKQGFAEVEFSTIQKGEKIFVTIMVDPSSLERIKK